jgi:hypothetical protein
MRSVLLILLLLWGVPREGRSEQKPEKQLVVNNSQVESFHGHPRVSPENM